MGNGHQGPHYLTSFTMLHEKAWKPFRNYFPVVGASRRPGRNQQTKQLQGTYWKLHNYVQTMGEPMIVGYPRLPLSPLSCGPITYTRESIYIARHGQGSSKLATAIDCTACFTMPHRRGPTMRWWQKVAPPMGGSKVTPHRGG